MQGSNKKHYPSRLPSNIEQGKTKTSPKQKQGKLPHASTTNRVCLATASTRVRFETFRARKEPHVNHTIQDITDFPVVEGRIRKPVPYSTNVSAWQRKNKITVQRHAPDNLIHTSLPASFSAYTCELPEPRVADVASAVTPISCKDAVKKGADVDDVQGREARFQPRSNAASGPDGDAWNASSEGEKRSGRRPTWLGPVPVRLGCDTLATTVAFVCCALCDVPTRFQVSLFQKMELRALLRSKKEFVADFLCGPRELGRDTFSEAGRQQLRTCVALYTLELRCSEFPFFPPGDGRRSVVGWRSRGASHFNRHACAQSSCVEVKEPVYARVFKTDALCDPRRCFLDGWTQRQVTQRS